MSADTPLAGEQPAAFEPKDRPRRLGDVADAASLLKCSVKTVRRQIDRGRMPGVVRVGRLLRVDLDVLGRWLDQGAPPLHRFDPRGRLRT